MTAAPEVIKHGWEGWMLAVPKGYTMQICDGDQRMNTDQAFIVIRKKVVR